MELTRTDLELIITQLFVAAMEQEEIAEHVNVATQSDYREMAQYFRDLSGRMKLFRDASNAEQFELRGKQA